MHPKPARRAEWPSRLRQTALAAAIRASLCGGLLSGGAAVAAAELPVPCGACAGAVPFVGAGVIRGGAPSTVGRHMTVRQLSERAILNWQSFDIAPGHSVEFAQPRSTSIALNRIHSADPSRIFGSLDANGQVYLYNANGILFGRGSTVDVNSLVATTLDVDDGIITGGGIVNAINTGPGVAAFDGNGTGRIELQPGARIGTDPQGRAILVGSTVLNAGTIETPEGQAILAASTDRVYLAAAPADDPNLRGILVEVGTGGTVTNTGRVIAERGNATLIGHAINQSGIVRATTSVALNGSVRLLARDQGGTQPDPTVLGRNTVLAGTRGGSLTLGSGSRTEVTAETTGTTAVDDSAQRRSEVLLVGETVRLRTGATVAARGGVVDITASSTPNAPLAPNSGRNADARIVLESGSRIDASGMTTRLDVTRNLISAELRGNELRDAPLQRNGVLRNATVTVDVREGTPLADLSGDLARLPRTVEERLSPGGDVSLRSEGDVVVQRGAEIDVSGGWIEYAGGFVATTKLLTLDGQIVDIGEARPDVLYAGIFGDLRRDYDKWDIVDQFDPLGGRSQRVYTASGKDGRESLAAFATAAFAEFEPGYIEGKDSGSISVAASSAVLDGTLLAHATRGQWQRELPTTATPDLEGSAFRHAFQRPWTQLPLGGQLLVGDVLQIQSDVPDFRVGDVIVAPAPATIVGDVLPADLPLHVDPAQLANGGISRLTILANGSVTVPAGSAVAAGAAGAITIQAGDIGIEGSLSAASGSISLTARQTRTTAAGAADVSVGPRGSLDVAGRWVNDSPLLPAPELPAPLLLNGGAVEIEAAGDLTLSPGSRIDASGGAWLDPNGDMSGGPGGDITLTVDFLDARTLSLGATLSSFGLARGGELSLTAPGFRVAPGTGARTGTDGMVTLGADWFGGGFSGFRLNATHGGLTVTGGTLLAPHMLNVLPDENVSERPSGGSILQIGATGLLRDDLRDPVDLAFRFRPKSGLGALDVPLRVERGARIELDPGARLALSADTSIVIDGTLSAPGGEILVELLRTTTRDTGFRDDQGIWLGANARLLAGGTVVAVPDPLGLRQADVFGGGDITLLARRGYVITAPGSLIDVSGVAATLDLPTGDSDQFGGTFAAASVIGNAGRVSFTAAEGVLLGGSLAARSAAADAPGGELTVSLDSSARDSDDPLLNQGFVDLASGPRDIVIGSGIGSVPAPTLSVPAGFNGQALIGARALAAAGFDSLTLRTTPAGGSAPATPASTASVRFEGDVSLAAGTRIIIDAPTIASDGGDVLLRAPYVALGHDPVNFRVDAATTVGGGHLRVEADLIELVGNLSTQGFAAAGTGAPGVTLYSSGDVRLRGVRFNSFLEPTLTGVFRTPGDLRISAAQVYPTTLTDYTLAATGPDSQIVFTRTGTTPAPLSAAGALSVTASRIVQRGTLRAPFGDIELDAATRLVLGSGSLTSVSGADLLVPFGQTQFGEDWVYVLPGLTRVVTTAPDKRVRLEGPDVELQRGAVIDVAGGGDLLAWEFLPGPGGSRDLLLQGNSDGAFAILPALGAAFAPWDPAESTGFGYGVGTTFEHSGGGGLPAGEYAVLPARYALLPGAWLVTPTGAMDLPPGVANPAQDGIATVAGRLGIAGDLTPDSRWQGFRLLDGEQVRNRSEYVETLASRHFAALAGAGVPDDAGSLSIAADQRLSLQGQLATGGRGRGSYVDIAADRIEVVNSPTGAIDRIELLADDLRRLGADSLLLGGRRTTVAEGVQVQTLADTIGVAADVRLSLPELLLVAADAIDVETGAALRGSGTARVGGERLLLEGDGALLRVSAGAQVTLARSGSPGVAGSLTVADGATLGAIGSITLDASLSTSFTGLLDSTSGALLLGANRISLGDTAAVVDGLRLSQSLLDTLDASELALVSRTSIDFIGDVELGSTTRPIGLITLDSAALRGFGGDATVRAGRIVLAHAGDAAVGPAGAAGTLTLAAQDSLVLAGGAYAVHGFTDLRVTAGEVRGTGAGTLTTDADVHLSAGRYDGTRGAAATVVTTGGILLDSAGHVPTIGTTADLGARWSLTGATLDIDGRLRLPSGSIDLTATSGDLFIGSNAVLDVSGRDIAFGDRLVGSPGGNITLTALTGDLEVDAGARLDASGASSGGDAGGVIVRATGGTTTIDADARLTAEANATARGGRFVLDTGILAGDFADLGAALLAGGFREELSVRLHAGDITVAADSRLRADRITLTADTGTIAIAGTLDARTAQGGYVALNAGGDITLAGSARLDARGMVGDHGGEVRIETRAGSIDIATTDAPGAASVAVGAGDGTDQGLIRLIAPRLAGDVAVDSVAGTLTGAARVEIAGRQLYSGVTVLDGALQSDVIGDADTFMAGAGDIANRLDVAGDPRFHVIPAIEIQGAGTLTLTADWDFAFTRPGAEAGLLVLRAAGDLRFDRSLSDGVVNADLFGFGDLRDVADLAGAFGIVGGERAWSWRAVAGADLGAADTLAVVTGTGDLRIAAGQRVRTGAGDIELAAGRDLVFADGASAVYTTGRARTLDPGAFGDSGFFVQIVQQLLLGGEFLQDGGDVSLSAGRDILGVDGGQLWSEWLPRLGGAFSVDVSDPGINPELLTESPTMAGVAIERFAQGVAALGGGDVNIRAGRDIRDLSASIPTTLMPTAKAVGAAQADGGGTLEITAGRDLLGGRYYVDRGAGRIEAGGAVRAASAGETNPVLALAGDTRLEITARGDVVIDGALNPSLLLPSATQGGLGGFGASERSYYFSYGEQAAIALNALAGDVVLGNRPGSVLGLSSNLVTELSDATGVSRVPVIYPGTLLATAMQGDVDIRGSFDLYPAPRGTLELLAGGDVYAGDLALVTLSDADATRLPTLAAPARSLTAPVAAFFSEGNPDGLFHAATPVHAGDDGVARIVARSGIVGSPDNSLILQLSKPVLISAGLDVVNLTLVGQHNRRDDVSTVAAGRDVVYPSARGSSGNFESNIGKRLEIAGPGRLEVLAGRDIDLGTSAGIRTTGDSGNRALGAIDESGAGILLVAGLGASGPDLAGYHAFQSAVFGDDAPELDFHSVTLVRDPGDRAGLFASLFGLVTASGAYALQSGTNDYSLGYDAIEAMFPTAVGRAGDVSLLLSRVATEDGGSIGMLTPGGGVNAGVTATSVISKTAAELGIVAQGAGDIDAIVRDDFLVNASRVFTLGGGDILVWSSDGSIDAGRGAKSAISAPPPFTVTDSGGNTVLVFPPAISGSGIRTVASGSGTTAGDVFLFAPRGIVSAGDAGIGGENILVGATEVLGADNIDVGGISVGVPAAAGGSLAVGLSGVGDVAGSATRSATDASARAGSEGANGDAGTGAPALAVLSVEVLGFGEENDDDEG